MRKTIMLPEKMHWRNVLMAVCSCLLVIGLYSPAFGRVMAQLPLPTAQLSSAGLHATAADVSLGKQLDANLSMARSALLAQGLKTGSLVTYVAVLNPRNVVPSAPMAQSRGAVGAVLSGNRLIVRGNFGNLTSPLRDYATDPVNPPNPNITSAFHIHQGGPSENGPFQYALEVMVDSTGHGGQARGEYTLTPEQLQALNNGMLYIDLHTMRNRGGELRGILMPG
jgi:hypothetical protein